MKGSFREAKAMVINMKTALFIFLMLLTTVCSSCAYENRDFEDGREYANTENTEAEDTSASESSSLEFSFLQGLKDYNIILDSECPAYESDDEKYNYFEFITSDDSVSAKSVELKALHCCSGENIQTQADSIITNYQSSATILFCENFSYSNGNTLIKYAIQDNETSVYSLVCILYDAGTEILCEFLLTVGDIEAIRVITSGNDINLLFENIRISETPFSEEETK